MFLMMFILFNVILVHHNFLNFWKRQRLAVTIPTHIQNFIVWVIKLSSWIGYDKKTEFIYRKLGDVVVRVNALHFGFNLTGFVEHFQYTSYGSNNDHYEWHMDKGPNLVAPRKLSLVLMLSDPNEYEGGELEFLPGMNVTVADNKLGRIFLFPSWLLHRVTPVTKGIRKTLVVWVSGPKFA